MADTTTTKILEVVVDNKKAVAAITHYNQLIEEQKKLQAELAKKYKDGEITQTAYARASVKINEEMKAYKRLASEVSKELQNNIKMDQEQIGSLRRLRAELSNLTKQYDSLSQAERESEFGLKLKAQINDITVTLKNSEGGTGRFFRNVGDYADKFAEALSRVGGSSKGLVGPLKGVKNGLTAISSTGIIIIFEALVRIIQKVVQSLKSSEATMNAVTTAMAPLNAAGRLLQVVMQKLGEGVAKMVTKLTEWADKLGLINEAMKVEQQLTKDELALQQREREVIKENADSQLKIAELKAKSADKMTYSAKERVAFLEEALKEEEAIAKRELYLAQERYRIQEEQSKLAENSKEENDELARSYAAMRSAETDYFNKSRELTAQLVEAKKQMAAENAKAAEASLIAAENEVEALIVSNGMSEDELSKALDIKKREIEARLKLIEKGTEEEYRLKQEQLKTDLDIELQRLQAEEGTDELIRLRREQFMQDMDALDAEWEASLQAAADAIFQEEMEKILAEQAARAAAFNEMKMQEREKQHMIRTTAAIVSQSVGDISQALAAVGRENKNLVRLSKILALAQIAIQQGVAIANAIRTATQSSATWIDMLAAVATSVTAVTAVMTAAISSVKSAKFATGGYVSGPGTGTSDSIPAQLSNGESVINARSTAMFGPLLSSLNQAGGGVAFNPASGGQREGYEFLAAAVASGMEHANVRVAVDEVTRVQDRVDHIKELSTIK